MRAFRLKHYLKTSLWVLPLLFVLGGILLALLTTAADPVGDLVPQSVSGDPTAAMQVLYLIAFAMLTLTGLVLSLVVVSVQLAMGAFSARIVRQILHDRPSQAAIGLFAGTFTHALLSIPQVQSTPEGGTVPGLAVLVAMILVLTCIGTLVWYINHIAQALRVAALVGWVADDTLAALESVYPDHGTEQQLGPEVVTARRAGVVFKVGHDRLVALAERADCRLELLWPVGDFVPAGAPLLRVVGDPSRLDHRAVVSCVALGPERTLNQDVAYGLRMLVDIAEQSLASGPFDDPTTAVQAIDRLHDILRQVARRPLASGLHHDAGGTPRLHVPTIGWDGLVRIAFDELRRAGADSPQVTRRLRSALDDLLTVAPTDRLPALEQQLDLLQQVAGAHERTEVDRAAALVPDASGIGSGRGLVSRPPGAPGATAQRSARATVADT